ncbi:MAG: HAD-IA family hydrolase [Nanoarchaeota archaeon]
MKKKRLICLDFDNTIIKSDKAHIEAYNKAFLKNGLKKVCAARLKKEFGLVGRMVVKRIFPSISERLLDRVGIDHHAFLVKETSTYAKQIPGAIDAIKKLKKKYQIAATSNCSRRTLFELMKAAGIDRKLFDICIGHDNVLHPKPAPDEIFKAEQLLHTRADYMVGDSIYDVRAGKKAKVKTIAVLTGNHSRKMLAKEKPFKIISSIRELPNII